MAKILNNHKRHLFIKKIQLSCLNSDIFTIPNCRNVNYFTNKCSSQLLLQSRWSIQFCTRHLTLGGWYFSLSRLPLIFLRLMQSLGSAADESRWHLHSGIFLLWPWWSRGIWLYSKPLVGQPQQPYSRNTWFWLQHLWGGEHLHKRMKIMTL